MSLFGDDYSGPPSRGGGGQTTKSSLFDDDAAAPQQSSPAKPSTSTSMFGDAADDDDGSSPWASFTPKKPQRRSGAEVVRSLLADAEVPESYVDAWEALAAGRRDVDEADVRRVVLEGSGIGAEAGERIWSIVSAGGESRLLGRGQVWVLFALVGLAVEGEELGLDAVDERRGRLPVLPRLAGLAPPKEQRPVTPPAQLVQQQQQTGHGAQSTPAQNRGGARKPSFGFGESDPWASPEMHKGHNHTNGVGAPPPPAPAVRTTSEFSTTAAANNPSMAGSGYVSTPAPASEAASSWGAADAYASQGGAGGFGTTPESSGGFGEVDGGASAARRSAQPRTTLPKGVDEVITIAMLEEKEGMFLFQHRNYEVGSVRRNSKVIRRYSDFVWLLECLHKRYPFRQLPLLPPKRMAINGNHIAADGHFVEKRRRGLARFANALVRHPVLREEQLVVMFLTVPTVEARQPNPQY
jgi:sorting nexin-8